MNVIIDLVLLDPNICQKELNIMIKIPLSIATTIIKSHIRNTKYFNKSIKSVINW